MSPSVINPSSNGSTLLTTIVAIDGKADLLEYRLRKDLAGPQLLSGLWLLCNGDKALEKCAAGREREGVSYKCVTSGAGV